jgi:hypothetical protein
MASDEDDHESLYSAKSELTASQDTTGPAEPLAAINANEVLPSGAPSAASAAEGEADHNNRLYKSREAGAVSGDDSLAHANETLTNISNMTVGSDQNNTINNEHDKSSLSLASAAAAAAAAVAAAPAVFSATSAQVLRSISHHSLVRADKIVEDDDDGDDAEDVLTLDGPTVRHSAPLLLAPSAPLMLSGTPLSPTSTSGGGSGAGGADGPLQQRVQAANHASPPLLAVVEDSRLVPVAQRAVASPKSSVVEDAAAAAAAVNAGNLAAKARPTAATVATRFAIPQRRMRQRQARRGESLPGLPSETDSIAVTIASPGTSEVFVPHMSVDSATEVGVQQVLHRPMELKPTMLSPAQRDSLFQDFLREVAVAEAKDSRSVQREGEWEIGVGSSAPCPNH